MSWNLSPRERLESRTTRNGECIEFTSRNSPDGYGRLQIDYKRFLAHRLSYELNVGPIPEGMVVRHKCDNKPCVNPEHLEVGTYKDNIRDAVERDRVAHGTANHKAKLTPNEVREIRRLVGSGMSRRSVAKMFGVSHTAVNHLMQGKNWRRVRGVA